MEDVSFWLKGRELKVQKLYRVVATGCRGRWLSQPTAVAAAGGARGLSGEVGDVWMTCLFGSRYKR